MEQASEKLRRMIRSDPYGPQVEDRFVFGDRRYSASQIVAELEPYITKSRMQRIDEVLAGRTRAVAPVVDGLANTGNVSAVMRTADALGCQPFHVIVRGESFKDSQRTSQGAEKWLDVYTWESAAECAAFLKDEGYRIAVTHVDANGVPVHQLDFTSPTAVVFGNEVDGVSDEMMEVADDRIVLPMVGFVQSYNISVAAAMTLYHAYRDRLQRRGYHGDLSRSDREELRAVFFLRSVRHSSAILSDAANRDSG